MADDRWKVFRIPSSMRPLGFGFYEVEARDEEGNYRTRRVLGRRRAERLMWRWHDDVTRPRHPAA